MVDDLIELSGVPLSAVCGPVGAIVAAAAAEDEDDGADDKDGEGGTAD